MNKRFTFRCSDELSQFVDKLAIEQSKPGKMVKPSSVVRKLIEEKMVEDTKEEKAAA